MAKKNSDKSENTVPYKQVEFGAFIKTLESGSVSFWQEIAEAIGVCKDTITDWQNLPEAKAAKQKGIDRCLKEMEKAGEKDWRMWNERLRILKVTPTEKHDITSDGDKIGVDISDRQLEQIIKARREREDS